LQNLNKEYFVAQYNKNNPKEVTIKPKGTAGAKNTPKNIILKA